jgi:hypothetical protein
MASMSAGAAEQGGGGLAHNRALLGDRHAAGRLRLAEWQVPAIYGSSGDVTWDEADPTDSVEAAEREA